MQRGNMVSAGQGAMQGAQQDSNVLFTYYPCARNVCQEPKKSHAQGHAGTSEGAVRAQQRRLVEPTALLG